MLPVDPQSAVDRLLEFQSAVRSLVLRSRQREGLNEVSRSSTADTIYQIDTMVEPLLEEFCRQWARTTPLVLVAEGLADEAGNEGARIFPEGTPEDKALLKVIVDPIDGTRGIMYDKRPAWALAAVAPNNGAATRLRDAEVAVMTELPTSKMGCSDVLWAIKGKGASGRRVDLASGAARDLPLRPSAAEGIEHGFATVTNFFPGTKVLAGELSEQLAEALVGATDVTKAYVFEDQYISTGGQFYELIVGHDRFTADLRPLFYKIQHQPEGMCCHPYDCAGLLVADEAGVLITDPFGLPLDGPLDVTTGIAWAGYANARLRDRIAPIITRFLRDKGLNVIGNLQA